MMSPGASVLRAGLARLIALRAGSSTAASDVAAAARDTQADLIAAFAPLISSAGVDALLRRAFDLARREFPADERRGENNLAPDAQTEVSLWLERQSSTVATDAAAAMFSTFADLLTTLIGDPLTTRYLQKAWPDGYSDDSLKRKTV